MKTDRRDFIRNAGVAAVGLSFGERFLRGGNVRAAGERVVVVVNLFGGNDGLNTVIPVDQYDRYRQIRGGLAHDLADLLPVPGVPDLAFNPGLAALRDLYAQGRVAIINGVAVPPDATGLFDHSAQQFEFQSCDVRNSATRPPTGWLGRYLDAHVGGSIPPGIDIGGGRLMLTGVSCDPMTINSIRDLQLQTSFDSAARLTAYRNIMSIPNSESTVAERNRVLRLASLDQSAAIQAATSGYTPAVTYPDTSLAFSLEQCARIIAGEIGVRALGVGIGGFDTHDSQNENGYHDNLLRQVSDAIGAFHADLVAHSLADRVVILTISEFGRTAFSNSSIGTDHGYSSVCFAIGAPVTGGVYGLYPSLADGDLAFGGGVTDITTDFRSVYATAFANFLGTDPVPLLGGSFPLLGYV